MIAAHPINQKPIMSSKIYSIQALRGIAALMVVLGHMNVYLNNVYAQRNLGELIFFNGAVGVDIFFIVSGFIICLATERKHSNNSVKFFIKRLLRIYPVYLFCFAVFSLVVVGFFFNAHSDIPLWLNLDNILSSLALLPLRPGDDAPFYGYSLIITAWTLSYEVYFYLIFLIAMTINHRYRSLIAAIMIVVCSYVSQKYFNGSFLLSAYDVTGISGSRLITIAANPINFDFILGMLSFYIVDYIKAYNLGMVTKIITAIGIAFSILCWESGFGYGHGITKFGIIAFILVLSVVIGEMAYRFTINRRLIFLGDISYSLYLCHIVVIYAYNEYGNSISFIPQQHGFALFTFLVLVSILFSYAMYRLIEQPSIRLSHRICAKL